MHEGTPFARIDRVAEQVRRELGDILQRSAKDPRLRDCVVARVRMSKDLRVAWVYLSVYPEDQRSEVQDALTAATGYLRRELTARVDLRRSPELRFQFDDGPKRLIDMAALVRGLSGDTSGDEQRTAPEPNDKGR